MPRPAILLSLPRTFISQHSFTTCSLLTLMSEKIADSTYQVWERVADDIDVNHLERLEQYHY